MARKIDKLGLDIRSFKEPLSRAIKQVVIPSITMNFHKHGRPRWPELSPDTIAKKGHARPLLLTGDLQKTMKLFSIWHVDREKALLANLPNNVWYGVVHQAGYGGRAQSIRVVNIGTGAAGQTGATFGNPLNFSEETGAIPARPFVLLQTQDEVAITQVFEEWLEERITRAGLSSRTTIGGI